MKQEYSKYTSEDFKVWKMLFSRQMENLKSKSCKEYLESLTLMTAVLNENEIPKFDALNQLLHKTSGWSIEVVPGMIPVQDFFELLAQKKFCSSTWLRSLKQLDYLEEPDMFHDIFGHIPLFMNQEYANFAQKLGVLGAENKGNSKLITQLQRIYWFTIEFGLVKEDSTKIFGAGIISSFGESNFVYSKKPEIKPFNLEEIINTDFCNSEIQTQYFELKNLKELYLQFDAFAEEVKKQHAITMAS